MRRTHPRFTPCPRPHPRAPPLGAELGIISYHEVQLSSDLDLYHAYTAMTLNNMAMVHGTKGNYDEALDFYDRALTIYETTLGPDHASTAKTRNNMAMVHENKGNYDEALALYKRALTIYETTLGPDHADTLQTKMNQTIVFQKLGDPDSLTKAEIIYEEITPIYRKKFGDKHLSTLNAEY